MEQFFFWTPDNSKTIYDYDSVKVWQDMIQYKPQRRIL